MRQKFKKCSFVKVCKEMPSYMSHFECDFVGIVEGTYRQLCGGNRNDNGDYSLYQLNKDLTKIVGTISWYEESQLTLFNLQDVKLAKKLIDEYDKSYEEYDDYE